MRKGRSTHRAKLTLISDFLQLNVVRPFLLRPSQSKPTRAKVNTQSVGAASTRKRKVIATDSTSRIDVKRTLWIATWFCAPKRAGRPRQHSPFVAAKVIDDGHKN
jgi:hypothetical protein